jgi:putative ABC transport system substrate-binding protein
MIGRREFITLIGGAAAWPIAARAQQGERVRRLGVLISTTENDPEVGRLLAAFKQGLLDLGWSEGRNVRIDVRFPADNPDRMQAFAQELVALKPDALLASGPTPVQALQRFTNAVPIVFAQVNDPVGAGLVTTLARPGGHVTGFTPAEFSIGGKLLELLKEIAPGVTEVGAMLDVGLTDQTGMWAAMEAAAPTVGVRVAQLAVPDVAAVEGTIGAFAARANRGLIVLANRTTIAHRQRIIALAAQYRLPAMYSYRYFVSDAGLASYGADLMDLYRRSASYVDRIFKGEKAGDLPVQQPTKYELTINLLTAKELGLDVPPTLLARADEVIE